MKHHLPWRLHGVQMSRQCSIKNRVIHLILLCLLIGNTYGNTSSKICGVITAGWTVPSGDIFLEVGKTLEIYCTLNDNYVSKGEFTSGNIVFYNGSNLIDQKYVTPVNETTARLKIDNVQPSNIDSADPMFYCRLSRNRYNDSLMANSIKTYPDSKSIAAQEEMVCLNKVIVGTKPKDVLNFTCISYNWEYMNVTWVPPKNGVPTNYSVYYQIPKRGGRGSLYECPNDDDIKEARCMWSLHTNPLYRYTMEFLTFTVNGSNRFGTSTQSFKIHHFAHILPNAPQDLKVINKTVSSIYLSWSIGHLHILEKGLVFKIEHTYNYTSWNREFFADKKIDLKGERASVNITGLEYPNIPYEFRVYSKSAVATSDEFWSPAASLVVRTASCPPYTSPKTDIGSFEIIHETPLSRDVLIYWGALPETEYNGDQFYYNISVFEENEEIQMKPNLVTKSYAKFTSLNFSSYRFVIRSINADGPAKYSTSVHLPKKTEIIPEPIVFTKIDYGDGIYELSWKCPDNLRNKISNFTTFWCESNKDRPYQCNGFLDWMHLPANTTKHNFTINSTNSYQFAISANSDTSSSGMIWASCTAIHNKLNKMKNVWIGKIGSDFIDVRWKLECSERIDSIKGYFVYYCVTANTAENAKCIEEEKTLKVFGDVTTMHANITNLKPFTNYKIQVAIFVKDDKVGPLSDEIIRQTLDGFPEVKGLKVEPSNITNNSVSLRWQPPSVVNGILRYYKVKYNEDEVLVNDTQINLQNLTSYTSYNIKVSACTLFCSEMEPIAIVTKMGIPGVVSKLSTKQINSSYVEVMWNQPLLLAGPSPIYDVKVQFDETDKKSTFEQFETTQTKLEIAIPNCLNKGPRSSYTFYVRAKNIDGSESGSHALYYIGDWSLAYTSNCMQEEVPTLLQVTIIIGLFVAVFCSVIFVVKKGYIKCQQMQDFDVTLPPKFINPPLFHNDSKHQDYHINIGGWSDDNAECDHLNSKLADLDQSSVDCIDMDLDTDRETDRSSSGCYTG